MTELAGFANVTTSHYAVLMLWGQGFDEIAASIFVAELRRLGIQVKLVGLKSRQSAGQYGLTLVPDLMLGQALRMGDRIHCIIVPAPLAALQQFSDDPRLAELLRPAQENPPFLVANGLSIPQDPSGNSFFSSISTAWLDTSTYPPVAALFLFIQEILEPRLRSR